MIRIKRIVSVITVFVLMFVLFTNTVTASSLDELSVYDEVNQYIDSVLKDYLELEGYSSGEIFYISNSFEVNIFDDNTIDSNREFFFIFKDNIVIGMITVGYFNNEYSSKYTRLNNEIIEELFISKTPFAVGYSSDNLFIYYNDVFVPLCSSEEADIDSSTCDISIQTILQNRNYRFVQSRSTVLFNKVLDVEYVSNDINPYTGAGLCWAATLAMKVNGHRDNVNPLSALVVLQLLRNKYESEYGMPTGTPEWIMRGYGYFGIACTYVSDGLTASEVSNVINNDKPIDIGLKRNGGKAGHGVVIAGCTIYSNHAIYVISDCNIETGYQYQDVSYSAMSNPDSFIYYGQYTYDDWYESYY